MNKEVKNINHVPKDWETILNERFSYLSKEEREQLIHGNQFVKVPSRELRRLRIDAYPYLM